MSSHFKGSYKYGEPKKQRTISITDTAWQWLQARGGVDYLERIARSQEVDLPKNNCNPVALPRVYNPVSYLLTEAQHDFIRDNGGNQFLRCLIDDLMIQDARIADEIRIDYIEGMK